MRDKSLMQVFHFTADDLQANKRGEITRSQIMQQRREVERLRRLLFFLPAGITLLIGLMISVPGLREGEPLVLFQALCLVQFVLAASAVVWRGMRADAIDSVANHEDTVGMVAGTIDMLHPGGFGENGVLEIGEAVLPITKRQYHALNQHPQAHYRIYAVERTLRILSVEIINTDLQE